MKNCNLSIKAPSHRVTGTEDISYNLIQNTSYSMGCSASQSRDVKNDQLKRKLTERQMQIVRTTWELMSDDMQETGMVIFTRSVLLFFVAFFANCVSGVLGLSLSYQTF